MMSCWASAAAFTKLNFSELNILALRRVTNLASKASRVRADSDSCGPIASVNRSSTIASVCVMVSLNLRYSPSPDSMVDAT